MVLLLISAGFVLFTEKVSEAPVATPLVPNIATTTDILDPLEDIDTEEDTATTSDDTQATTSTTTDLEE